MVDRPYDWDALKGDLGDAGKAIALHMRWRGIRPGDTLFHHSPALLHAHGNIPMKRAWERMPWRSGNAKYLLPNLNFKSVNVLYKNWLDKGSRPYGRRKRFTHPSARLPDTFQCVGHHHMGLRQGTGQPKKF
jgi:hypothetical protein